MPPDLSAAFALLDIRFAGPPLTGALRQLRQGFPWRAVSAFAERAEVPQSEVFEALAIPSRTLSRRKREGHFSPEESGRLLRLARVVAYGTRVLGDRDAVRSWLHSPCRALGGLVPSSLLDTEAGGEAVLEELGRSTGS